MTNEKKKELFPYFAWVYSKQMDPGKYGETDEYEEWAKVIEDNPKDIEVIAEAASTLTDEQWSALGEDYQSMTEEAPAEEVETEDVEEPIEAKKGAKLENLKKLQSLKKGKALGAKKCGCGCAMVTAKEKGGKIVSKCSCGCKMKK